MLKIGTQRVCPTIENKYVGIPLEVSNGTLQKPNTSFTYKLPNGVTNLGNYAMSSAFRESTGLLSVDAFNLTTISGNYGIIHAFNGCTNLASIDLSSLTTVSGTQAMFYAFYGCTSLTSIVLSSLTTLSGSQAMYYAFSGCTNLASIDLSSLTTVSGSQAMYCAFENCTKLTSLSFPSLNDINNTYTRPFQNMLKGITGCTVHFPSNLQSVIGSWADVTAGFGGTNTTVLFDLPATT